MSRTLFLYIFKDLLRIFLLTSAALARREPLRDLSVSRPSLEEIYLELTASEREEASTRA